MRIDAETCRDPELLAAEVRRLREAIRRLAEEDATLSVCDGNVTVTLDATLTDEEREALQWLTAGESPFQDEEQRMAILRGLLERMK